MNRRLNVDRFRVKPGTRVRLRGRDPADTRPLTSQAEAAKLLDRTVKRMYDLTEVLYAQDRWALLLIFQAMDAAGKDSAIKHVMRGLDPKATQVYTFKVPTPEELDHDFMWRCMKVLPERGRIGVFNRSYYEEVLVVRVRPEFLEAQHLPPTRVTERIWQERFEDIKHIERYLARNGTVIRKFFLNVSKAEQRRRFLQRLEDPAKNWKFSINDVNERLKWDEYMRAYEEALAATSTREAPWYVIPADHKWFTRLAIAQVVTETLQAMSLRFPPLTPKKQRELKEARRRLRAR